MRLHRFIGDFDLREPTQLICRDRGVLNQLKNVLRLKVGDTLILGNGQGREGLAQIEAFRPEAVIFTLSQCDDTHNDPAQAVTLYLSLLKRENFELVAQKATEVGITRLVPLLTTRTVKTGYKPERLLAIMKEAAEQSGRGHLPSLGEPLTPADALLESTANRKIFFDGGATKKFSGQRGEGTLALFIGPEGGWTAEEFALAEVNGAEVASLGSLTLRAETAAIVASYLAVHKGEDHA